MLARSAAGAASTSRHCAASSMRQCDATMPLLRSCSMHFLIGEASVKTQPLLPHMQSRAHLARGAGVALRARGSSTGEPWWEKESTPNMRSINSVQELVDALAEFSDKLVIVDFFAPWCGSCRALYPKLCQLVSQNMDTVVLLKVDFENNKALAKGLGVKVLPYFQLYRGAEGRVDAFAASVSKIQRLKDALELHGGAFCSLGPAPDLEEFPEVHPFSSVTTLHTYDFDDDEDTNKAARDENGNKSTRNVDTAAGPASSAAAGRLFSLAQEGSQSTKKHGSTAMDTSASATAEAFDGAKLSGSADVAALSAAVKSADAEPSLQRI